MSNEAWKRISRQRIKSRPSINGFQANLLVKLGVQHVGVGVVSSNARSGIDDVNRQGLGSRERVVLEVLGARVPVVLLTLGNLEVNCSPE